MVTQLSQQALKRWPLSKSPGLLSCLLFRWTDRSSLGHTSWAAGASWRTSQLAVLSSMKSFANKIIYFFFPPFLLPFHPTPISHPLRVTLNWFRTPSFLQSFKQQQQSLEVQGLLKLSSLLPVPLGQRRRMTLVCRLPTTPGQPGCS